MGKIRRVPDQKGFDIVVWQKSAQSTTWACGYTRPGADYLRLYDKDYVQGRAMNLDGVYPEEFFSGAPNGLKIGGIDPYTKKTEIIARPPLH